MKNFEVVIFLAVPSEDGCQQHYTFNIPGENVADVHEQITQSTWFVDQKPNGISVAIQVSHITDIQIKLVAE